MTDTKPMAICRAALIALGAPKEEVQKLVPGAKTDTLVYLCVMKGLSWERALAEYQRRLGGEHG